MTAPINIEKIFPSFELLSAGTSPDADTEADEVGILDPVQAEGSATLASGAVATVSLGNVGSFYTTNPIVAIDAPAGGESAQTNSTGTFTITGVPANGKKVTIDGNDITFGDVASGVGEVKTDIVGTSAVAATGEITVVDYSDSSFTGGTIIVNGITLTEGNEFSAATDNDTTAASIATAVTGVTGVSASSTGPVVTVSAQASAGASGNTIAMSSAIDAAGVTVDATLSGGVDVGNVKDDLAASLAQYIRSNVTNFSAEAVGAIVTVEFTGTNGTDPASPIGDTKSISTDAGAINVSGATLSGGAVAKVTAVATASLYADTDATNRGTIESITVTNGGSGYSSAPTVTIPKANGNTIEKIGKLGADMVSGGGTFNYAKDYIAIALEDFNLNNTSGSLANPLSSTEASEDSGDYRKLIYHILRKSFDYLNSQESVDTVTVSNGGTGYASTDTVAITGGGGEGATGTLTVSAGVITAVNITNPGSGYTTPPSAIVTSSTGNSAVLVVNLTDNTPEKFSLAKGFLSENTATNEVTRDYTASFTFDESGLEMASES